jgi:hypothetical protein
MRGSTPQRGTMFPLCLHRPVCRSLPACITAARARRACWWPQASRVKPVSPARNPASARSSALATTGSAAAITADGDDVVGSSGTFRIRLRPGRPGQRRAQRWRFTLPSTRPDDHARSLRHSCPSFRNDALMVVNGSDGVSASAVLGLSGRCSDRGYCWVADKTGIGVRDGTQALIRSRQQVTDEARDGRRIISRPAGSR